ncbi:MAG: hypothetical protein ACTSO9_15840 [Candidatus Helarchaeota archaeon]
MAELEEILNYIILGLAIGLSFVSLFLWTSSSRSAIDWSLAALGALALAIVIATSS